jgi:4-amino-4-deoxy-L-arabinose transferase-like glycosyltransferase
LIETSPLHSTPRTLPCIFPAVSSTTPAIVSQTAVRRLPRLALFLFCLAYVLPGFVGREPWKSADVSALGVMLEMASGATSWWIPQVLGQAADVGGSLPYWLGASFINLLPFLPADYAVRVAFAMLLGLTLLCAWYAVYHLARQASAQPVAFAFGGEASPKDYARALADAGLLALIACLGLAQMSHETTPDLARLCASSALMLAGARMAHADDPHRWATLLMWWAATAGLAMSGAPWVAMASGTGLLLILTITRARSGAGHPVTLLWAATGLALIVGAVAIFETLPEPMIAWPWELEAWQRWGRLVVWFTWPAWPLALWTLWGWRRQLLSPHVAIPLWIALVSMLNSALNADFDRALLLALPAMAALAAFALPTLRRSVSALIDWFTLLFFSLCALIIWVVWFSMQTGVPAKPAENVARLAPGFAPEFSWWLFLAGALATLAWMWLVQWRVGRNRQAIWKSLVLPAAGATLCWVLLMTLWLPLLDFARSYGPLSRAIARVVPASECVLIDGLTQAQIAALQYHGQLHLKRLGNEGDRGQCGALVMEPSLQPTLDERVDLTHWAYRASASRLSDRKERLLIYLRVGK